jgi:uncharacterized repeat protein (TIGR01451 family)
MRTLSIIALLSLLSTVAGAVQAATETKQTITLKNVAEVAVAVVMPDGKKAIKHLPVSKATVGTEIIYTTTFTNTGEKPAGSIIITNPVPENTCYVRRSASGANTDISFSVDGGKSFSAPDKLKIMEGHRQRPVRPSDITHVRWTYRGELAAGKSSDVSFKVVIK